jgi:hypothetical protein
MRKAAILVSAAALLLLVAFVGSAGASVVPHAGNYTGSSTGGHHVSFQVHGSTVLNFRFGHSTLAASMTIHSNGTAFYRNTRVQVTCHWLAPTHVTGTVAALSHGTLYHWSAHL